MDIVDKSTRPSWILLRHARTALKRIPPKDVEGVHVVQLIDEIDASHYKSEEWYSHVKSEKLLIYGMYHRARDTEAASISLPVSTLFDLLPGYLIYTPVPVVHLTRVLAHEVGHHLIALGRSSLSTKSSVTYKQEEEFAESYADEVLAGLTNVRGYRLAQKLLRYLAENELMRGILDFREKKYDQAVSRFYRAAVLDKSYVDASNYYWRAKSFLDKPSK